MNAAFDRPGRRDLDVMTDHPTDEQRTDELKLLSDAAGFMRMMKAGMEANVDSAVVNDPSTYMFVMIIDAWLTRYDTLFDPYTK